MEDESNGRENLNVYVPPEGRLARSEVPIKKEFLKPVYDWRGGQKRPRNEETNDGDGAEKSAPNDGEGADASQDQDQEKCTASSSSSSSSSDKQPNKKKGRFTKSARKERKANTKKALYLGKGLCHTFCNTGFCSYGDSCRMSHDLAGFMAWKPADLLEYCPVYERTGTCPMGIRCRYASKHTNPDGSQIPHPDFASKSATDPLLTPLNVLDRDTLFALKKREMDFTKTKEAVLLHTGKASTFLSSKKAKQNKPPPAPAAEKTAETIEGEIHLLGASGTDAAEQKQIIREEKKTVDFKDKLILAPLTTIGNLPYRRICKRFGADITVGEMALSINLLQGSNQEWALAKRHPCEDVFGVQLAGSHGDNMGACAELISERLNVDFIDVNCGCPIDLICDKGAGSSLLERTRRLEEICKTMSSVMMMPLTVKIRTGYYDNNRTADKLVPKLKSWGVSAVTIHGRTREQRYTKLADWEYIDNCSKLTDLPVIGNGDIYNYTDVEAHKRETGVSSVMLARGAIIKPWLFEEIKQQKHWDISGSERLDILKDFSSYGLEYWGSDDQGVENTRSFLLNWLSFTCRYVPVGILEVLPTQMNHRPPPFVGRDDRETLLSSNYVEDWIKISEMLLGPVPDGFHFEPKHKANSFSSG